MSSEAIRQATVRRLALAIAIAPLAGPLPDVSPASWQGLVILGQQILIGVAMGFAMRIVFTAVDMAGELIGLQMGLNFAGFFNPMTGGEATAVSRFFGISVSWLFIVINGHLLLIAAVVQSFNAFPVSAEPFAFLRAVQPQVWGAEVFRLGLWIALPLVAMLLFVNLVLGIISRVAQQMVFRLPGAGVACNESHSRAQCSPQVAGPRASRGRAPKYLSDPRQRAAQGR